MHSFLELPLELRYDILEYAVTALSAPLDPPDVKNLDPREWTTIQELTITGFTPVVLSFNGYPYQWANGPLSLLLVNKTMQRDTTYVWKTISPRLPAVINVDCVEPETSTSLGLPIKGILLKWLSLPPVGTWAETIEVRIRYFDHKLMTSKGIITNRHRVTTTRGKDYCINGIKDTLHMLVNGSTLLFDTENMRYLTSPKKLNIVFVTTMPTGFHWSHTRAPKILDSAQQTFYTSLHPSHLALDFGYYIEHLLLSTQPLNIDECRVNVDEKTIYKIQRPESGGEETKFISEEFSYDMPVNPLFTSFIP